MNDVAPFVDLLYIVLAGLAVFGGGWLGTRRLFALQADNMTGIWSNEDNPESPHGARSIDLYIEVTGAHVRGYLQAWHVETPSSHLSLRGWRIGPFVRIHAGPHRKAGFPLCRITLRYYRKSKRPLLVFSYDGPDATIPRKAEIWRVCD
ncbi:hypothetical protein BSFA1_56570 [Burkholderia sp. SFA1]|uniref:hypothetical protein n=1 Tax=Caballeronia sp. CLC5 TaxID=2906764 RepID=UPI001F1D6D2B|nr:hypothetical protein [Caballeronia sp. CLC5]MCE4573684.1 hypothetical protein [Caballeronia sp. CLC5]BBQ00529.1 hypothetical protein BSFA1_56570 [Burkholderia sp. SFA1]